MKTMAVEITIEQSALVHIRVPDHWDPKRMQAEFSDQQVLMDALEVGAPCWEPVGNLMVTHVRLAHNQRIPADYVFPDEGQSEQAGLLLEAA